ncbi:MAG: hypothetical protein BLITH_1602 [Brockia lithotrophica]|uniref:Uncharacterized protein n=1 Tax=Brockia lithotrophica TaxID=933949 RepID=A0A2T5G5T2_9BACL|nr:MAG: hypothetical protein BLITH_1602 [Brockia lithotrophica]
MILDFRGEEAYRLLGIPREADACRPENLPTPGVFMRAFFFPRLPASRFRGWRPEVPPHPRTRLPGRKSLLAPAEKAG